MALLKQDIRNDVGAILTKLLVKGHAADGRGVTFHLDHVAVDGLGFLRQRQQLGDVLRFDFYLAIAEIDRRFVKDIVIVQLAETRDSGVNSRLVGSDFFLLLR